MAGSQTAVIEVRRLTEVPDLHEAVRLQQQVWNFQDIDLLPVRLFVVASKIGGQVFGAFDGSRMVGFCLAIPGLKPGGMHYLHSHMLGVLPEYRNAGVGRRLKLAQREEALARGIGLIEWTFDPLQLKNAYFNVERLGAIVRRHVYNQYGITSNTFDGGLPSDRLVAEWWLSTPRVEGVIARRPLPLPPVEERVEVPAGIDEIRKQDPQRARAIQASLGEQFQKHFSKGLAVVGVERSEATYSYLLSSWQSE